MLYAVRRFFVNMWYNKNDYEDQRMTIRIHDDVENNYVEHIKMSCEITVKGPYLNYSRCYLYIGNTQKVKVCDKKGTLKWSTSNKKVATVSKSGKIAANCKDIFFRE